MVKARDIMTTDVTWVKKETSIYEAGELLLRKDITGMPVVEDDMTIAGVITEKDVLRLLHTDGSGKKTVEDFMTWPAVYYEDENSIEPICNFLLFNYFRRVPVISSKTGKLVGIISRPDVLRHILKLRCPGTSAIVKTVGQR